MAVTTDEGLATQPLNWSDHMATVHPAAPGRRVQRPTRKRPGRPFTAALWRTWLASQPGATDPTTERLAEGIAHFRRLLEMRSGGAT